MPNSGPLTHYQHLLGTGGFEADPDQLESVQALDLLWHELQQQRRPSLLHRLRRNKPRLVRGLYLWGSVGRGKTWLMDLFFEQLPVRRKQRIHFHRFMQRIHSHLRDLGSVQDPLPHRSAPGRHQNAHIRIARNHGLRNYRPIHGLSVCRIVTESRPFQHQR